MRIVIFLAAVALMAGTTVLFGWWAVPVVAGLVAFFVSGRFRFVGALTAFAAVVAWGALLAVDAAGERFGALAAALGAVMQLPAVGIVAATLVFPGLLAWSAGTLGDAGGRWWARRGVRSRQRRSAAR